MNEQQADYWLHGKIDHEGNSLDVGHYTATVLYKQNDIWSFTSDDRIAKISKESLMHNLREDKEATIIVYKANNTK